MLRRRCRLKKKFTDGRTDGRRTKTEYNTRLRWAKKTTRSDWPEIWKKKFSGYIYCTVKKNNKIEPWHDISNSVVCATSKASDQPAYMRSLMRAFASRLNILWVLSYWSHSICCFYTLKEAAQAHLSLHLSRTATLLEITFRGSNSLIKVCKLFGCKTDLAGYLLAVAHTG